MDLQIFDYEDKAIRTITSNNETWWIAKDVCKALNIKDTRRVVERLENDEWSKTPLIDSKGRKQETYTINEFGLYSIIIRSNKEESKQFRKWVTHVVLPSIRKTGKYSIKNEFESNSKFLLELKATDFISNSLNLNEASKISLFKKVYKSNNMSIELLPEYTEENITKSLTELLKNHDVKMSPRNFNKLLEKKGFLESKKRKSSKSTELKIFKSLTEKGILFGKNLINPHNQKETQPHYFENKFLDLLKEVGLI